MLKLGLSCDPKPVIKNLDTFKAKLQGGLFKTADEWGADTVGHIQEGYLSGPRGEKLGVVTGRLRSSIRHRVREDSSTLSVSFGTDVPYGPIHEMGGKTPPRVIQPKDKGGVLSFLIGGRRVFAKSVTHPGSNIPARPFMRPGITDTLGGFKETIALFLREAANGFA